MNIDQNILGGKMIIAIQGRLDTTTSDQLRQAVAQIPDDIKGIVFDMKDLEYISSAGLRELMICAKKYSSSGMKIINVSPKIMEIFEVTGFDTILSIEKAEEKTSGKDNESDYVSLSVAAFLSDRVNRIPDHTVCKYDGTAYTWRDIDEMSDIAAAEMASIGVDHRSHVGLCAINSINWIIAFYAIQKLGAMALLVNPNLNTNEIVGVADISDMTHLCYGEITTMKDEDAFVREITSDSNCRVASCYSIRNKVDFRRKRLDAGTKPVFISHDSDPDDPCIMVFTSGSTGRPKGVLLSAYNVLNAAKGNRIDQNLKAGDRTCLILPLFHIFGLVAGLFSNAVADSTIIIPHDIRTGTLLKVIRDEKCTHFHSVPTMLIALINNTDFNPENVSSVRSTIISGAAATESQIRLFQAKFPGNRFMSSYGLSEMAPVSITEYEDTNDHVLHTVGRPVRNIQIKVVDRDTGAECPAGSEGEILVQGYNLMTGYYKLPLEDQSIDSEGWLHTGDLGYMTADGYLALSGRIKELIIRGGENIMPREVESAMSEFEEIENVKVIGIPSSFFGEEVCACVKVKPGHAFHEGSVQARLEKKISKFKVPSKFVVFEQLPVLGTGKIDVVTLKEKVMSEIGRDN